MRSLVLVLSLLIPAPLVADEVRLKDGTVIVGKVKVRGKRLEISTRDGTVRVDRDQVLRIRDEAELAVALSEMASRVPNGGFGRLELARIARDWGLEQELWSHLDAALALPARDKRRRLEEFLASLEPEILARRYRNRPTETRVRELLRKLRPNQAGLAAAVEELLVREPDADETLRDRARRGYTAGQRVVALAALVRRAGEGSDWFLYRTAILDGSQVVRREAMKLAQLHGDTAAAVRYLAPALLSGNPIVRIRTANAYGNLEDVSAVEVLVEAGPKAGVLAQGAGGANPGVRGHIAIMQQQAYIRDFNVEVAQAAFIADPIVGVIQSGVVLDVTVAAVVTHRFEIVRAYRGALKTLLGSDPGSAPSKWAAWMEERVDNGVPKNGSGR